MYIQKGQTKTMRMILPTMILTLVMLTACQTPETGDWVTHQRTNDQFPFAVLKAQGDDDSPIIAVTCINASTWTRWEAVVTWWDRPIPVIYHKQVSPPYIRATDLTIQWDSETPQRETWEVGGTQDTYLAPMMGAKMTNFMQALKSRDSLSITAGEGTAQFDVRGLDATLDGIESPCAI